MTPVVDTCSFVPTSEMLRQWFTVISRSKSYLRVFWQGFAHWSALSKREYFDVLESRSHDQAVAYFADRISQARAISPQEFVNRMDEANVRTAVIHNGDYQTYLGVDPLPFEYHAELAHRFPGRFCLLAGVDPLKGRQAVEMFDRCVKELGYKGLLVIPFRHGVSALDEAFKPLYRRCQELGAPVWIHSTTNWDPKFPIDLSSPRVIDRLAIEFPEMTILAGHAGWPWVLEMVTVAWRHPNVYLEVSAFRPQNMAEAGYGFESLLYFGNGPIQNKVTFGSTWNLLNLPMQQIFQEVRDLPITPQIADKWLHHNAAKAFKLA